MTSESLPSLYDLIDLSERVRRSLDQLKQVEALRLPREKRALVQELKNNSQTFLVFLEESAQKVQSGESIEPSLLGPIKEHCQLIDSAVSETGGD